MRLQSSLGSVVNTSTRNDRVWNMGALSIGRVTKVHYKRYTADVDLYPSALGPTKTTIMSDPNKEGRNACRIMCTKGGFDPKTGKAYGQIMPIYVGDIVVVGFLDNNRGTPVILGVLNDTNEEVGTINEHNMLTNDNTLLDSFEQGRQTDLTPTQDFRTIDGQGNFQLYSHTHSFLIGTNRRTIDPESYHYSSLDIRNPDGTVVNIDDYDASLDEQGDDEDDFGNTSRNLHNPLQILACFMKQTSTDVLDSLRIWIDSAKSVFRIAQVDSSFNNLSTFFIDEDGSIHIRRQLDTTSFSPVDSVNYSEMVIYKNGDICFDVSTGDTPIKLYLSGGRVSIISDKDIELDGDGLSVHSSVDVYGSTTISGDSSVSGSSHVNGDSTIGGSSTVTGDSTVGGNATVTGSLSASGITASSLNVTGETHINMDSFDSSGIDMSKVDISKADMSKAKSSTPMYVIEGFEVI